MQNVSGENRQSREIRLLLQKSQLFLKCLCIFKTSYYLGGGGGGVPEEVLEFFHMPYNDSSGFSQHASFFRSLF